GHWSLVIGHWSLVIGHWSLVIGQELLAIGQRTNPVDILSNLFSVSIFPFYNLIQIFLASKVTLRG
ncbi:MAG: hypothetical protein ACYTXC_22115, partial [Nostoc sp.]